MVVHKNYYYDVRVRRYVESLVEIGVSVDVICLSSFMIRCLKHMID